MKKMMALLLSSILTFTMLVGCSSNKTEVNGGISTSEKELEDSSTSSRKALEKEAISIYEDVNGVGSAERDGFSAGLKDLSDTELNMILGH